jgi:iron complex transport system ATP-binding protein
MLTARGLQYGVGGRPIVLDVEFSAPEGAVTGILGPNGAGKSTLLQLLAGTLRPEAGGVWLGGRDLLGLKRRDRARTVALVEQGTTTELSLTVRDVALLGRVPYRSFLAGDSEADVHLAMQSLAAVGMEGFEDRPFGTLSGGERQRVQIARSLVQEPRLLLLDEPTNHLDIHAQLSVLTLARSLTFGGVTVVAALHDLNLAAEYCDYLVVMSGGSVVSAGTVEEVLTPRMIRDVYAVEAEVFTHPTRHRPIVTYSPIVSEAASAMAAARPASNPC